MSFVSVTSGEIASGKAVKSSTMTTIKNDLDDLDSRTSALETANSGDPPILFTFNGAPDVGTAKTQITTNLSFTITGGRLLVATAGSAGTLTVDILKKRGAGSFTSIFSTQPSVAYGAGDEALSTNGVLDGSQTDVQAGDILRLDIITIQTAMNGFTVRLDFTR